MGNYHYKDIKDAVGGKKERIEAETQLLAMKNEGKKKK